MSKDREERRFVEVLMDAFAEATSESEEVLRKTLQETGADADALSEEGLALVRHHLGEGASARKQGEGTRPSRRVTILRWRPRLRSLIPILAPAAAAVLILSYLLWGRGPSPIPSDVTLMLDQADLRSLNPSCLEDHTTIPATVQFASIEDEGIREIHVDLGPKTGATVSGDAVPSRGAAMARLEIDGVVFAGVCPVAPGHRLLRLGGPGSRAMADFMHVASLHDGTPLGERILGRLPFLLLTATQVEEREAGEFRLDERVSVACVDDAAVYDGDMLFWSESFEEWADGEYPESGLRPVFPERSGDGLKSQGWVTSLRASRGGKAFSSLSVPGLSRHDGIEIDRNRISTGILTYEASIWLNSADERGFLLGLKQRGGDEYRRYDKASVRFLFGEIRAGGSDAVIAHYVPGRWCRVRVVADLRGHTMSVWIDGREVAQDIPTVAGGSLKEVRPEWTEQQVWEDFDEFSFGGAFYGGRPGPATRPLPYLGDGLYVLEGDRYGWRATGLRVQRGEKVSIEAEGTILFAGDGIAATDPDGCHLHRTNPRAARLVQHRGYQMPAPGEWMGSLVARIGSTEAFFVGSKIEFAALESGELYIAYNDHFAGDNSGSFRVRIVVR